MTLILTLPLALTLLLILSLALTLPLALVCLWIEGGGLNGFERQLTPAGKGTTTTVHFEGQKSHWGSGELGFIFKHRTPSPMTHAQGQEAQGGTRWG